MFFEVLIFSLIIAKIRGGRLGKILRVDIKGIKLVILAVSLQLTLALVYTSHKNLHRSNFSYINILVYLIFLAGIFLNRELKGFKFIGLGSSLNLLPLIFNKGKMPVSLKALQDLASYEQIEILSRNKSLMHSLESSGTRLKVLIDWIPLKYIIPKVISLGDIFIALGLFIFIYFASKGEDMIK